MPRSSTGSSVTLPFTWSMTGSVSGSCPAAPAAARKVSIALADRVPVEDHQGQPDAEPSGAFEAPAETRRRPPGSGRPGGPVSGRCRLRGCGRSGPSKRTGSGPQTARMARMCSSKPAPRRFIETPAACELLLHPALPDAGDEPTVAEPVEGGQPAREDDRALEERVEHAGAQGDPAGPGGDVGEGLDRVVHRRRSPRARPSPARRGRPSRSARSAASAAPRTTPSPARRVRPPRRPARWPPARPRPATGRCTPSFIDVIVDLPVSRRVRSRGRSQRADGDRRRSHRYLIGAAASDTPDPAGDPADVRVAG